MAIVTKREVTRIHSEGLTQEREKKKRTFLMETLLLFSV